MLISHSKRFIFIHIYKVAGESIKQALCPFDFHPNKILINRVLKKIGLPYEVSPYGQRKYPEHITALELRRNLPKKYFENYFKFAFVRNPWDWQVSNFHYGLKKKDLPSHNLFKNMKSFQEYIEWKVVNDKKLQKDFVCDEEGNIIVDYIGKMESIDKDFNHICNRLDINVRLPHINKTSHPNYNTIYNDQTRKLIEFHFKEDIQLFDYKFEDSL